MKILYIAKTIIPSRTANSVHVMKMCQALSKCDNDVWLCLLNENNRKLRSNDIFEYYNVENLFKLLNIPIIPHQGRRLKLLISSIKNAPTMLKMFRSVQPDLVYGRDIFSCSIAVWAGLSTVIESHFPLWHGMLDAFSFRHSYKKNGFKRLIVISKALKKAYLKHYKDLHSDQVIVAPDGADPAENLKYRLPRKLGRMGALQVGYIGHLYEGKGMEVIEAVAAKMPDVDFHIVGGLEKDIETWKRRITESNVTFHGFISQKRLPEYITMLDICLLPNQNQVFSYGADATKNVKNISPFTSPLKMFEYMSYGKPIIASDLPVLREVLNEEIALMVKPNDYEGWISAINMLRDPEIRKSLGSNAKKVFLGQYTWKKRAQSILADLHGNVN